MRCSHCPYTGDHCRGEDVSRFCDLVNPHHASYTPAYARILGGDDHALSVEQNQAIADRVAASLDSGDDVHATITPCCGGNPYG